MKRVSLRQRLAAIAGLPAGYLEPGTTWLSDREIEAYLQTVKRPYRWVRSGWITGGAGVAVLIFNSFAGNISAKNPHVLPEPMQSFYAMPLTYDSRLQPIGPALPIQGGGILLLAAGVILKKIGEEKMSGLRWYLADTSRPRQLALPLPAPTA